MAKSAYREEGVGYLVKQRGAYCMECRKQMGKSTIGVGVRHGRSFVYYHPACYKRRGVAGVGDSPGA
jgi:hypothetical protein